MAVTKIADIYEPVPFEQAIQEAAVEKNAFIQSGVMVNDARIAGMANVGGSTGDIPFYNAVTADEPDYVTDNDATSSTPAKIGSGKQKYHTANMHKSWSTMDLARELALADPVEAITVGIGGYWATHYEKRIIQSSMGVLANNVAADSSDMLFTVATDAAGAITDAERISGDVVIEGGATMGDAASMLSLIAVHSVVFKKMQKDNLITTIPNAENNSFFNLYLNKYTIIVDDSLPAVAGSNRITYTSILYAAGAMAYGEGSPTQASELEREASAGNGGGQDILHSRKTAIILPYGTSFLAVSVAGQSPTLAELATAGNWDRVYNRKNVNMAFIQTNG
jgi:hypothetical protein